VRLTCPACGAVSSAEAWMNDADARAALRIVAELPWSVSRIVLSYLALFRTPGKGLKWTRALKLLADLDALMKASHVQWEQRPARANSAEAWGKAMERIIEHPPKTLPLKNHNYLRAVAWEIADDIDKQLEKKRIQAEQTGDVNYYRQAPGTLARRDSEPERISFEDMKKITEENFRKKKGVILS